MLPTETFFFGFFKENAFGMCLNKQWKLILCIKTQLELENPPTEKPKEIIQLKFSSRHKKLGPFNTIKFG